MELDCDIRWRDIAEHLAEGAGDEEASVAEGASQDGENALERLAVEDAKAMQQYDDEEAIFGMEEAVEGLHLTSRKQKGNQHALDQPGALFLLF